MNQPTTPAPTGPQPPQTPTGDRPDTDPIHHSAAQPGTEPATGGVDGRGIPRRSLLRAVGLSGATIAVLGTAALSYRVFDTAALDPDRGDAFDPWRHWQQPGPLGCVAAAILAANPHNSQAWAFAIRTNPNGNTVIDVSADHTRSTGTLDPLDRELQIGLGCALENLTLAATSQGLDPTVTLLPDGATGDRAATITLVTGTPSNRAGRSALYQAIPDRHTNRGPYQNTPVPAATLDQLVDTTGLHGLTVTWVSDAGARAALGQLLIDAAIAITRDDQQSRDSFAWFRAGNDDIQRHRDGLTLNGQGLSPLMLTAAKLLPASSRAAGDDFWVKQTRTVHTATAAAYGVITADDHTDPATRLQAGRLLQRIHLTATARGIALHHLNQITERIDREHTLGAPTTFAPRFAELLPTGQHPLGTFRVGHPTRTPLPSPRRPITEVTR